MTQLVELQGVLNLLDEAGVAVFSISYDPVDVLQSFADREGIDFPLLSDEGSEVISRLGMRNDRVHEQHAVFGFKPNPRHEGVPYPGVFVLDESGTVIGRRFFDLYRERETGPGLIERTLGIDVALDGPTSNGVAGAARVTARLDSAEYKSHQRVWLLIDIDLEPGSHVFATRASAPYQGVAVEIDPVDGLFVGDPEWPEPTLLRIVEGGEELPVHEGRVRGAVPLRLFVPRGHGDVLVTGRIALQVCTETTCDMPGTVEFSLPLAEGRLVRPG